MEFKSDGCSVPAFLRKFFPKEALEQCAVCEAHDLSYWVGGTIEERSRADNDLYEGLVEAGMSPVKARIYWIACRIFGGPELNKLTTWACGKPVAWATQDNYFKYDEVSR